MVSERNERISSNQMSPGEDGYLGELPVQDLKLAQLPCDAPVAVL